MSGLLEALWFVGTLAAGTTLYGIILAIKSRRAKKGD